MKKILIASLIGVCFGAMAADYASVDVGHVRGQAGGSDSRVQVVRAGTDVSGIQLGVQDRTARFTDGTSANSLELTAGKAFGIVTPFVGYGRDNGNATTQPFSYELVGASVGAPVAGGFAYAGAKTRVLVSNGNPKQTVEYIGYSYPVTKKLALNVGVDRSFQTIKEHGVTAGVSVNF